MKIFFTLFIIFFCCSSCFTQNIFSCTINDKNTGDPLPNVSIIVKGDLVHTVSDNNGNARIVIKPGKYIFKFSSIGYKTQEVELDIPIRGNDSVFTILMKKKNEVIIFSTRTNSRIENTATKVEVLGAEELDEESGVKPSHIASLLGDVAGIQTQQTSAVSGNTDLRIQGLPGSYTQILRDGLPLFGGFAGSFSILQIPPLDIKQIEIIKGASSTLYGGGAIAGMINIISKKPREGHPERSIMFNQSSLQESNLNIYLSERKGKIGYTFFVGANYQKQKDIDNDGFSDVGRREATVIHPTFFFYPNEKNTVSLSINSSYEDRLGGDMEILAGYFSNFHQFFIQNQTFRNTIDLVWEKEINSRDKFTLKAATSNFNRDISSNVFGMKAKQLSYFMEASYLKRLAKHDIVAGLNVNGENLKKRLPDSTLINNFQYFTVGLFVQDDWRIHPKVIIQSGLRTDYHNRHGTFILPRISMLYKINPEVTMRLGGGWGYKIPTVFDSEVDERDYPKLQPLQNVKAERSTGFNWDVNFKKDFGKLELAINQSFYFTQVNHPLLMQKTVNSISYFNASKPISTKGIETWLQVGIAGLEAYIGYTLTDAKKKYDPLQPYLDLSAREKFASVVSYKISKHFRIMIEASKTGKQYLEDGSQAPSFPLVAGMMRVDAGRVTIVLNCENIFDYRQTKKESIVIPPYLNPSFKPLWAPIDGRVANLSVRIKF